LMDEQQEAIIQKTKRILTPFDPLKTLLMILIYVGVVIGFFLIMGVDLDPYVIGTIVVILIAYFVSKDFLLARHYRGVMASQTEALKSKQGEQLLYVPLIGKNGSLLHLKPAAIFLIDDILHLEVFERSKAKNGSLESITVPIGDDFSVHELEHDPKLPLWRCLAKVKGIDFGFFIVDQSEVLACLKRELTIIEKEVK